MDVDVNDRVVLENGAVVRPVATFNGGNSHFIVDDGCYVLINRGSIFKEAWKVLRSLFGLGVSG